jgi:hypothetical protein
MTKKFKFVHRKLRSKKCVHENCRPVDPLWPEIWGSKGHMHFKWQKIFFLYFHIKSIADHSEMVFTYFVTPDRGREWRLHAFQMAKILFLRFSYRIIIWSQGKWSSPFLWPQRGGGDDGYMHFKWQKFFFFDSHTESLADHRGMAFTLIVTPDKGRGWRLHAF